MSEVMLYHGERVTFEEPKSLKESIQHALLKSKMLNYGPHSTAECVREHMELFLKNLGGGLNGDNAVEKGRRNTIEPQNGSQ